MKFQVRGFVSLCLMLAFVSLSVSGVMLYVTPRGRVTNWTGWTMLGLDKQAWQAVHTSIALAFLVGVLLHLWFNWSIFWCYLKKKASMALKLKAEMLAATLFVGAVLAGAIYQVPPFGNLMDLNHRIKDHWDQWAADAAVSPPTPHAEEFTLERLAASMEVPLDEVIKSLKEEGLVIDNGRQTLGELAEKNALTPRDLCSAIHKHFPDAEHPAMGLGQGRGQRKGGGGQGRGRWVD